MPQVLNNSENSQDLDPDGRDQTVPKISMGSKFCDSSEILNTFLQLNPLDTDFLHTRYTYLSHIDRIYSHCRSLEYRSVLLFCNVKSKGKTAPHKPALLSSY